MAEKITRRDMLRKAAGLAAAGLVMPALWPAGTARAVSGLSQPILNVKDYGAKGTAYQGQNDAQAFQNALNALTAQGGGTLYIPAGDYFLRNSIFVNSNITLLGDFSRSARIHNIYPNHASIIINQPGQNISILHLQFHGAGTVHGSGSATVETAISIKKAKNVTIQQCSFTLLAAAIQLEESSKISISDCEMVNIVGAEESAEGRAIVVNGSEDITIENNRFLSGYREYIYVAQGTSGARVMDNQFSTKESSAVVVDGSSKACSDIHIVRNQIHEDSVQSKKAAAPKIWLKGAVSTCKVSENTIWDASQQAIVLDGITEKLNNNLITANWIMQAQQGIVCNNASRNIITNNSIDAAKEYGIVIDASGSKAVSDKNIVAHNILNQSGKAAIYIANERCKNTVVQGNTGIGNKQELIDHSVKTEQEKTAQAE